MKPFVSLFFILLISVTGSVHAFNGSYPPSNQSIENPVNTIQTALDKLQKFSANRDNTRPELLRGFIENEIIPHFAFDQMTYWIAGPFARRMNTANLSELETRVVSVLLFSPNQRPDRLNFRMKANGNSWKIIDVTANGISAALYYRKHFISTLRQY